MIIFNSKLLKAIYEDAKNQYPNECCGILLGERDDKGCRRVKEVYEAHNAAEEKIKRNHFTIQTETILYAEFIAAKNNYEIIGFYHSHTGCGAAASEEDSRFAIPGMSYPIVSVEDGQMKELSSWEKIRINEDESFVKEMIEIRN